MPDNIVFPFFLILSLFTLLCGSVAGYLAFRYSHKVENEIKMIGWAMVALACIVFGGLIWAWFLFPIIANHI